MRNLRYGLCAFLLVLAGCGGSDDSPGDSTPDAGNDPPPPPPSACDYRAVDGIVVIEAESLPITADWLIGSDADASDGEFIQWTGSSNNNNTAFGRFEVSIGIDTPGLYRLQWRTRVGMGDNATEHNDTWVQFPDADAFYGIQGPSDAEDHVYPRPQCEDDAFIASIEALDNVTEASCPNGTSRDGYFKVYSSGALDWKWSASTSDSDAHRIVIRFDQAGSYTFQFAARGDFHQIDRIVIHDDSLPNDQVQDPGLGVTSCP